MSKGFLTIAQNGQYDYVKMAYVLGMSLKISQKKYDKLSIIVNKGETIPTKYKFIFDNIIYIDKPDEDWKIHNKWQYYSLTPYDETIVLDTDMLFFHDISTWWKDLESTDIDFTTSVKNYRNETITSDYYRKVFTNNNLPNLYTALFYFKKSSDLKQYFTLVRLIFENWNAFYKKLLKEPPKFLSGDVVYALAAKIYFNRNWNSFLTFSHMRSRLQDENMYGKWNKELPFYFNKQLQLKVNNFNQLHPFHYIQKDFLSEEVIELYEEAICLL